MTLKRSESVYAGLVGELLVGAFLGPSGAGLVPEVEGIRLVGEVALTLLVFEGGLHVDIERIGAISKPAFLIATFGTIIPLLLGWGLLIALGYGGKESLAAGTALSSTSIGMATRILQDNRMLRTPLGSLISVAAMVDDVLSLVILSVLQSLSGASSKPWTYARPVVASIGSVSYLFFYFFGSFLYSPACLAFPSLRSLWCACVPEWRGG